MNVLYINTNEHGILYTIDILITIKLCHFRSFSSAFSINHVLKKLKQIN